jgi:hypothetical protein
MQRHVKKKKLPLVTIKRGCILKVNPEKMGDEYGIFGGI